MALIIDFTYVLLSSSEFCHGCYGNKFVYYDAFLKQLKSSVNAFDRLAMIFIL
jgi:hypothetical protein